MNKALALGQINFINCLPINLPLPQINSTLDILTTNGYPAQINQLLRQGDIDLAPISSFEYISNPDKYQILEGISISSKTQADSVLLLAQDLNTLLNSKEIFVTNKSATSVNLLKIILGEKFKLNLAKINFISFTEDSSDYPVKLLIGDEALGSHPRPSATDQINYNYVLDLGTAWHDLTQLPMVFALWCFNKNSPALVNYHEIQNLILQARDRGLNETLPDVIIEAFTQTGLPKAKLLQYFHNLDYNFTEQHQQSLNLFTNFLQKNVNLVEK